MLIEKQYLLYSLKNDIFIVGKIGNIMNLIPYDVIGLICQHLPLSDLVSLCFASKRYWEALNSKKLAYCWHYKHELKFRKSNRSENNRSKCNCDEIVDLLLYGNINIIQPISLYEMHTGFVNRRPDQ